MDSDEIGEPIVVCPVDGCDETAMKRGLYLHVRQTSRDGHGETGTIPDGLDMENPSVVGYKDIPIDYPEDRIEDTEARLCPYCMTPFNGIRGLSIHFTQIIGRKNHPKTRDGFPDVEDCPIVVVDEKQNIIDVVDAREIDE